MTEGFCIVFLLATRGLYFRYRRTLQLLACQKKSTRSKYLLVLMPQVFQAGVLLSLLSNKVIDQGPEGFVFHQALAVDRMCIT